MIHTSITRNCVVFLSPRRQIRSAIYGSQIFDSNKWPTVLVLVRKVKEKPCNVEATVCESLCSTFKTSFEPHMHFTTNGYKHFSKTNLTNLRQHVPLKPFLIDQRDQGSIA